ncbi:Holliday junction branch migration protein RuvA [Synechococcus elongatus]|uniref:Holliday junction branch migration complex subunit RuvA n=2 Tax=Synechococcus elongatus TaxID=32046 RepID=RUVA_SYNE7|nr:Holliday junction branch migration protein RuvA [Synechococcus elongatus]Q31KU1.1 RecName: Full=Holliday junction branch migration complex subunit RuvA [Synechococcus elongatus PCC 7942 = FACHB-805]Q5N128.1 RecName: Full=Holliday junction branch migration complex subunit RuvA [Synechococcus elongatus PCC 6301]ABB58328.1 Holliday junction DNA helicase subunit RuvA [Synechococcus elongatus PCC 7942 = FACHB-805]AJD57206.1 ATP-dependent DNA helicase RuvA [Synechococcus elongatus UTEX 2973]MBD25
MIGYLQGSLAGVRKQSGRLLLLLDVQGVGYEVQTPARSLVELPAAGQSLQVFTHLQVREDQWLLFGFLQMAERDLFRQLISVSGIGPQLGLALLDSLSLAELVQAIVAGNTRLLSRTPGVGAKTAERLALELRSKLAEWREEAGLLPSATAAPIAAVQEDVEMTLLALGYNNREILQALTAIAQENLVQSGQPAEDWIREAIAWLSR